MAIIIILKLVYVAGWSRYIELIGSFLPDRENTGNFALKNLETQAIVLMALKLIFVVRLCVLSSYSCVY